MIVGDVNRYIVDAQREKQRKTDRWNMESRCTRESGGGGRGVRAEGGDSEKEQGV